MAVFTFTDQFITGPDKDGKRKWVAMLQALNYNDTIIQAGISSLLPFAYGKNVTVNSVDAVHIGTIGVTYYGYFALSGDSIEFLLRNVVTTSVADYFRWAENMTAPVHSDKISAWINIFPTGYAATDDLYLIVRGEVW